MATVPTILYYWSIFLMVEFDAKRFGAQPVDSSHGESVWSLTRTYWYHFSSLIGIIVLMVIGFSPIWAVFWATVLAFLASYLRPETALVYKKAIAALSGGSIGVLGVACTCASAGVIVGVVTLTGLGLKLSSIIIGYAEGNLFLTAVYTGILMWIIGLAVPVTATYIIGAVIAAPALIQLGVPDFAAGWRRSPAAGIDTKHGLVLRDGHDRHRRHCRRRKRVALLPHVPLGAGGINYRWAPACLLVSDSRRCRYGLDRHGNDLAKN